MCFSLRAVLVGALGLPAALAQLPASAPACVRACATTKISEGYCSSATVLATAFAQCLRDHCSPAEQAAGSALVNTTCTGTGSGSNTTAAPTPPASATNSTNATAPVTAPGNSSDYGAALSNALRAAGLGSLATLLSSPSAAGYVSQLQQDNHTVFAPSDSALAALPLNSSSPADITALLQYHTVPGLLDPARLPTNTHAIVRSSLGETPYVSLPANDSQVLVLTRQANGTLDIVEPSRNITVSNGTRVANLELAPIPNVLTVPGTLATVVAGIPELSNLTSLVNGSAPQLWAQLDQTPGLTIFAPINSALANPPQGTNYQAILLNHIVNGSVLYSTVISNTSSARSAGGTDVQFTNNGTGTFASQAGREVQILQTDIVTRNGVLHLVNGLFQPANSTPTFPLVNTNNATETVGITAVDGSNLTSTAQGGAQQASGLRLSSPIKSLAMTGILALVLLLH